MALDRYRAALRAPGVPRLLSTSLVARMPNGMSGLAILLLVTRHHGYARAGLVTGLYVAAAGLSNLLLSRAADRVGPRRVLVPSAAAYAAGMLLLAVVPGTAYVVEMVVAGVTGLFSPPVVSVIRGLWPRILEPEVAQAVYGLEATAQELIFILGPALVALIAGVASAPVAVAVTGVVALVGTWACASSPELAGPVQRMEARSRPSLRGIGLPVYVTIAVAITIAFNMCEIAVVAFVSGEQATAASGVVLAVWSLGSLVGGLWFGAGAALVDDTGVARAVVWIAAGLAVAAAAPGDVGLAVLLFVGGAAVAPGLARLYSRVGAVAPAGASTEAFGWIAVGLLAGSSVGAALGGVAVDTVGPRWTFLLAAVAPAVVAVGVVGWAKRRRTPEPREAEPLPS
jgi:MFS family permease